VINLHSEFVCSRTSSQSVDSMICKMVVLGEPISRFTHMLRMTLLCA